jgi:hypothetical protein
MAIGARAMVDDTFSRFRGTISTLRRLRSEDFVPARPAGPFVRLRLALSANNDAGCEPLVAFEGAGTGALLTVTQSTRGSVRFGFWRRGAEPIESPPINVRSGRTHELIVRFEKLGPSRPGRMLLWRDAELVWAPAISWDGTGVRTVSVGKNQIGAPGCAAEFRGTLSSAQHDQAGRDPLDGPGDLRMSVRLPAKAPGQREPLVVTGRTGAGEILVIEYLDAQTVRFGWDHWGTPMVFSAPVMIDFAEQHTLDIAMGSLRTVADATLSPAAEGKISVAIDGRRIWEHAGLFFPAESAEMAVGRNPIGGTGCGPIFTGEILSAERILRE